MSMKKKNVPNMSAAKHEHGRLPTVDFSRKKVPHSLCNESGEMKTSHSIYFGFVSGRW